MADSSQFTFIDLFSGCGGFSLGLKQAGLNELAAIDNDLAACKVFAENFSPQSTVLHKDLTEYSPEELAEVIKVRNVDVIVGGPPCQGFSTIRQVDGANSGKRLIHDPRRDLYKEFVKYVDYFRPKIFVMENVLGIRSAGGGEYFESVQRSMRDLGYTVFGTIVKAWEYGVPQKRTRQLIIGTKNGFPTFSVENYFPDKKRFVSINEALSDLPELSAGEGLEQQPYDLLLREKAYQSFPNSYLLDVLEVDKSTQLTAHKARRHSERDIRDFQRLREGENSSHALARGETMEFPYARDKFKDRFTRQDGQRLSSTIVAHLSKDGLMFIHPTQNRTFTPREAARIQSFPDWFTFSVSRTHQYKLIGNAVPPLLGKTIGEAIKNWLQNLTAKD